MNLIQIIELLYNIKIGKIVEIRKSIYSEVYYIFANGKKYILKRWKKETKLRYINLIEIIHKQVWCEYIPKLLVNKKDDIIFEYMNNFYSIYEYIEHTEIDVLKNDYIKQMANSLNILHIKMKNVLAEKKSCKFTLPDVRDEISYIVDNSNVIRYDEKDLILRVIDGLDLRCFDEYENYQYIHGDYNKDNVLFKKGKLVGIIDFENVVYDSVYRDIAMGIISVAFDKDDFSDSKAQLFCEYYDIKENMKFDNFKIYTICIVEIVKQLYTFNDNIKFFMRKKYTKDYLVKLIIYLKILCYKL